METTMEKKKITQRTLNTKEKLAGVSFMKEVVVKINLYLTRAIQTANEENQVTREEFWDHLFCPSYAEDSETDKKKKYYILDTKKLDRKKCPENPYQKLDFQGSNKYLLYGTRRELPSADGKVRYAQDSLNYCKKFNLPYTFSETKPKKNGPSGKYRKTLWDSIIFRNEIYAHDTPETVLSIDLVQMNQWMQTLEELTEPLTRKEDWNEGRLPLKEFWKHTKEAFNKQSGIRAAVPAGSGTGVVHHGGGTFSAAAAGVGGGGGVAESGLSGWLGVSGGTEKAPEEAAQCAEDRRIAGSPARGSSAGGPVSGSDLSGESSAPAGCLVGGDSTGGSQGAAPGRDGAASRRESPLRLAGYLYLAGG